MQCPARAGEPWQRSWWQVARQAVQSVTAVAVAVALTLTLTLAVSGAMAQSTTSNIQGTVSDETGVLPGATVTARETQSGFQHSAVTTETGSFALAGLRPGSYEITVSLPQYKPQSK